jgi:hypothetical protein
MYELNKSKTIRANLSFGLGLTTIKESNNWVLNNATTTYEGY